MSKHYYYVVSGKKRTFSYAFAANYKSVCRRSKSERFGSICLYRKYWTRSFLQKTRRDLNRIRSRGKTEKKIAFTLGFWNSFGRTVRRTARRSSCTPGPARLVRDANRSPSKTATRRGRTSPESGRPDTRVAWLGRTSRTRRSRSSRPAGPKNKKKKNLILTLIFITRRYIIIWPTSSY